MSSQLSSSQLCSSHSSSSTNAMAGLTPTQLATFRSSGYLILPSVLSPSTVSSLLAETHTLLSSFSLHDHPMTRFTTIDRDHVSDDYFLTSSDKIRFFFDEDAIDPSSNTLLRPKERAVNKIGHALHVLSPPFKALLSPDHESGLAPSDIARSLGFRDPRCLQSMVICKQPETGGAVPPHQDSTFLYTDPPSAVGFWYALEDATLENGCLSFLPGSHQVCLGSWLRFEDPSVYVLTWSQWAPVTQRLVRKADGSGTEVVPNSGPHFPPSSETYTPCQIPQDGQVYVPGEVKAGSLVLIHGNLLHKSERNLSQKGRIIYTFHIIEGEGSVYDEKNWLQPPREGFTQLYSST